MKKGKLINHQISELIGSLGHTDEIVIADAGLPIPDETTRIDLALTRGIPSFEDTLNTVMEEMFVEKAFVSEDISEKSPEVLAFIKQTLGDDVPIEAVPHTQFKERTKSSRAIIRTGEFTPFANVILVSGPWGFEL
ncbi:MAG TPA: D-ribose pyranase [Gammaproteobacteria bacterium]|nr:D-ribose pyranase [Gammaproteobacteria bacterium]|tara:strand:- start:20 stop:427 length:408 start_codon:yes stop_codon:yes gene_type:complete